MGNRLLSIGRQGEASTFFRLCAPTACFVAGIFLLGSLPHPTFAQAVPLDISEFQVNEYSVGFQNVPAPAMTAAGEFLVTWTSEGSAGSDGGESIQARLYGKSGDPLGPEFQVNEYTTDAQFVSSVAADEEGNFVIVWASFGSFGTDNSGTGIQVRRYRLDGTAIDPVELQINTYTTDDQAAASLDVGRDGSFVVVWYSRGSAGTDQDSASIQARRFAADGTPLDPAEFQVNSYTTGWQIEPDVEILADGSFVVSWTSYGSFGSDDWYESVQARRFAADGTPLDPIEFQVNAFTPLDQYAPRIDSDPAGNFVVAWTSRVTSGDDTHIGVQARRFAADGTPLDPIEFQVNTFTPSGQLNADVAANAEGDFVVTFQTATSAGADQDGSVQARRYRADGTPVDATEFQLNAYTTSKQAFVKVDSVPEGDFIAVWSSRGSFGNDQSYESIQARRFGRPTIPVTSLSGGTGGPGCTLRDAITAANSGAATGGCAAGNEGAVVELPDGATIALDEVDNGLNALPRIERPVTIRGEGTRIERDPGLACPLGPELRLAEIADGGVLALEGVALSNGCLDPESGAGVLVDGGTLVLRAAAVEGNETGGDGGGVAVVAGNLLAFDSTLRGNLAAGSGG
ncbi:MAG TPA: hypothetical protein VLA66_08270, partial [Thermoanaerobaculia bacterium]|nr:hypothetical protein [Thermoanaerobaculia bacterium]